MWQDMEGEDSIARMIEFGGRHCYRAWEKGRSRGDYITNIIEMNHGSVLEHATINWAIQGVSRSLSLELARHRVGIALSQESQRYVDASEINFVVPPIMDYLFDRKHSVIEEFHRDNIKALDAYKRLQLAIIDRLVGQVADGDNKADTMAKKRANEAARALLPNDTETRFLWTTNMRLLLHFLWLRGGMGADLEIRRLAVELLRHAQYVAPEIFNSMTTKLVDGCYGVPIIVASDMPS
jgi:thymidylate synthase (FAD)